MKPRFTILVCGSNGQLGNAIKAENQNTTHHFIYTDIAEMDISSEDSVEENIQKYNPNIIVNCAAYTAVDIAEEEQSMAELLNTTSVTILSDACYKHKIFMIHISTDYVYDGRNFKPYEECDPANPLSVYGYTKLQGEQQMILSGCNGVILRTSWLYSEYGNNFVKTILKHARIKESLNVVFDQVGTPTYANDLAHAILAIADNHLNMEHVITYNFSNEGACSWYDFAQSIVEIANLKCHINPIKSTEYQVIAQRPYYTVLDKTQIKTDFKINIPHWRVSLKKCIKEINGNKFN